MKKTESKKQSVLTSQGFMNPDDHLSGSVDMIILGVLEREGSLYGLEITRAIEEITNAEMKLNISGLYPALHRLVYLGALESQSKPSPRGGVPVTSYNITELGKTMLAERFAKYQKLHKAICAVVQQTNGDKQTRGAL